MAAGIAAAGLLLDSNILIDLLRGEAQALAWIEAHAGATSISVISWMEILVGCHDDELGAVEPWLSSFPRLELTRNTRDFPESLGGVQLPYRLSPEV